MELKDFVVQTLSSVGDAVIEARTKHSNQWIALGSIGSEKVWREQQIEFDLAVTQTTSGGGGISVMGFGEASGAHTEESVNRVKFSIPVFFNSLGDG